jgi:lipoprotein signal peptidase
MVLLRSLVRSLLVVPFGLMTHSLPMVLFIFLVRSRGVALSVILTRSAELVLLANLAHFLPLVLLRWMVRSVFLVLSLPLTHSHGMDLSGVHGSFLAPGSLSLLDSL